MISSPCLNCLKKNQSKGICAKDCEILQAVQDYLVSTEELCILPAIDYADEGRFVLNSNINVLQALTLAGGLSEFAVESKIKIFRKTTEGTKIIGYNYDEVIKGKNLGQNIALQRGDTIVVPY